MSDLDDEELEATRRLNGVAREKNKERTDINVGSIEEDIKRCEQLIKPEHASWIGISNQSAIAHLIEKIKELEEENATLRKAKNIAKEVKIEDITQVMNKSYEEFMKQFVSKQKVKDKIEELEKAKNKTNKEHWKYNYTLQIAILKELLEEK